MKKRSRVVDFLVTIVSIRHVPDRLTITTLLGSSVNLGGSILAMSLIFFLGKGIQSFESRKTLVLKITVWRYLNLNLHSSEEDNTICFVLVISLIDLANGTENGLELDGRRVGTFLELSALYDSCPK